MKKDQKAVQESLKSLPKDFSKKLFKLWPTFGEKDSFASRWLRFLKESEFLETRPKMEELELVAQVLGNSSFLSRFITRHPETIRPASSSNTPHFSNGLELKDLRHWKYSSFLWLFGRRISKNLTIQEEWTHLTSWADSIASHSLNKLSEEIGNLNALHILALGKLGARELNLSSDIDIVYFIERNPESDRDLQILGRLAKRHVEFLTELLSDGFLYRVDLRLRPSGTQGSLVQSTPSIIRYYEAYGKTWERAVLLRARVLDQERSSGKDLLEGLHPFIYRRFIDHGMIDDLKDMKARIDQNAKGPGEKDRNIKTGQGGIRAIEFVVQAFHLIYGGQLPEIRNLGTIETLEALGNRKLVDRNSLEILLRSYPFLRNIEHGLQWIDEAQTHEVPPEGDLDRWNALAALCPAEKQVKEELTKVRSDVQSVFDKVFLPERRKANHLYWDRPWKEETNTSNIPEELLSDVEGSEKDVQKWLETISLRVGKMQFSARATRHFRRLIPKLIQQLHYLPDPEEALSILLNFIEGNRARSGFFLTLAENPKTLRHLLRLFSTSKLLAETFTKHPELLDSLLLSTHSQSEELGRSFQEEVIEVLHSSEDRSWKFNRLRQFKREQFLRVALRDLSGEKDWSGIAADLTSVSVELIRATHEIVLQEKKEWAELPLLVVAMGSLGAGEMSYTSDVDLIFLVDDENEEVISRAVRCTQRMITGLTLYSEAGTLFKVDMRLRPSGNQGPLVSSLRHFETYHEEKAQLWERQSLLRARPIAGPLEMSDKFSKLRDKVCFSSPRVEVSDLKSMRERLQKELTDESGDLRDLKLGKGGLSDIEFLVAYFQMSDGHGSEELRDPSPLNALKAIGAQNLLTSKQSHVLSLGYSFLRQLENRLRLMLDRPISAISLEEKTLKKLHRGFNLGAEKKVESAEELKKLYQRHTEKIRGVYQDVLGKE